MSAPLEKIHPSPTQPRRHFRGLAEMAATMKEHGILQKPTVRPHPSKPGEFELIFGERRTRSAKLAGFTEILVEVNDRLSDEEIEELQLIENVQRDDLDPFEEGESYKSLRAKGKTLAQIAALTKGKSESYVAGKIRLSGVCKEAREAYSEGKLNEMNCLEVARLAPSQQVEATKTLIQAVTRDGDPCGEREGRRIIVARFHLKLAEASFPTGDASLVVEAGACTTCPKRTGNQAELFGDVKSKDVCTDFACFSSKRDAQWERDKAKAKECGQAVIEGKKAKALVAPYGRDMLNLRGTGLMDLHEESYAGDEYKTLEKRLGKAAKNLTTTLLRNPETGKVYTLVDAEEVAALLPKDKGNPGAKAAAKTPLEKRKAKAEKLASVEVLSQVYERLAKRDSFGKTIAKVLLEHCRPSGGKSAIEGMAGFLERTGLVVLSGAAKLKKQDERDGLAAKLLDQRIESADEDQLRALMITMLCWKLLWWPVTRFHDDAKIVLDSLKIDAKGAYEKELGKLEASAVKKAKASPPAKKATAKKLAKGIKSIKKKPSK